MPQRWGEEVRARVIYKQFPTAGKLSITTKLPPETTGVLSLRWLRDGELEPALVKL